MPGHVKVTARLVPPASLGVVLALAVLGGGCLPMMLPMMGTISGRGTPGPETASATDAVRAPGEDAEIPWIEVALAHARDIDLSAEQEASLRAIRDSWRERAGRTAREIRLEAGRLRASFDTPAPEPDAVRAAVKRIASLQGDARFTRVETVDSMHEPDSDGYRHQ